MSCQRPNDVELPKLTPFETARARIAVVPIADADRRYLDDRCDDLEAAFNRLAFTPGDVVLHGDANVGNLILDRHDHALLSDLDSFCIGPREWDLVLTAMFYRRFGWHTREEYDAFVSAYGADILDWDGFDVLADVRELLMVAWLAQNARDRRRCRGVGAQARHHAQRWLAAGLAPVLGPAQAQGRDALVKRRRPRPSSRTALGSRGTGGSTPARGRTSAARRG